MKRNPHFGGIEECQGQKSWKQSQRKDRSPKEDGQLKGQLRPQQQWKPEDSIYYLKNTEKKKSFQPEICTFWNCSRHGDILPDLLQRKTSCSPACVVNRDPAATESCLIWGHVLSGAACNEWVLGGLRRPGLWPNMRPLECHSLQSSSLLD